MNENKTPTNQPQPATEGMNVQNINVRAWMSLCFCFYTHRLWVTASFRSEKEKMRILNTLTHPNHYIFIYILVYDILLISNMCTVFFRRKEYCCCCMERTHLYCSMFIANGISLTRWYMSSFAREIICAWLG